MKILFVASECTPFAKVGGLGDVIGALPKALSESGIDVSVILPLYKPLLNSQTELVSVHNSSTFVVEFEGGLHQCELHKTVFTTSPVPLFLIKNDTYLSNGGIYLSDDAMAAGNDEPRRFMFFCKAVYALFRLGVLSFDVVHCHDWHTSLLLKLLKQDVVLKKKIKTVLSVHNLGNLGTVTDPILNREIDGTPADHDLMEVGVDAADVVVPVSRNYAQELLRGEFCFGLEKCVQRNKEKFHGITNGIDTDYFNPQKDPFIGLTYSLTDWPEGKRHSKTELLKKEHWDDIDPDSICLFGFVGRIAEQKNITLMIDSILSVSNHSLRFVFLGVGEAHLTEQLHTLALKHNNRVKFINRFDESYARLLYAGSDVFLVPSLYEPCGLTQMIAMRYGSVPIGRAVGGLVDTIDDRKETQTGFLLKDSSVAECTRLFDAVGDTWFNKKTTWNAMVNRAMQVDFSWDVSAR